MGIHGLLPLLKSIMAPIHIKELEGCCVAVDTYSWLHKGALSCSRELCKGLPTSRHVEYCMHRVNLLRHFGVKPILVFDGGLLPMKMEQENKRARARKENLTRAIEHEANGNSAAAYECYQKAVDISPAIAHELIQVLKQQNVSYIVAPYEADAQMAYLAITKQVDAIITEDSDLIPFGCPRIIFKMDKFGQGVGFQSSMLQKNRDLQLVGFTKQMFLEMCILSGCDYLPSMPGMGLKRAHALITRFKSYERVIKHLKYSTLSVSPYYEESFRKAILTFQHQRVYDPITQNIVHLSEPPDHLGDDLEFLGPLIPQHIAKGIAEGNLDPFTQMQFQGENASPKAAFTNISNPRSFKPETQRKRLDLPLQKNLLTKYFCFASLEAKRRFKAPRVSAKLPSPTEDSPRILEENSNIDSASPVEKSSLESSPQSDTSCYASPADTLVENGSAATVSDNLGCQSYVLMDLKTRIGPQTSLSSLPVNSVHKTHPGANTESNGSNETEQAEGRTKTVSTKVIVRSRFFQRKNHHNSNGVTGKGLDKREIYAEVEESAEATTRSTKNMNSQDTQRIAHGQDNIKGDNLMMYNKIDTVVAPRNIPSHIGSTCIEVGNRKRKSHIHSPEKENMIAKHLRKDEAPRANEACGRDVDPEFPEIRPDDKFGANISHLSRYSEIAEKSMESFVSVISSFRFGASGSRASGLRAPLKDIRNTCPNRSSGKPDFSQFAYVPTNGETSLASRRF